MSEENALVQFAKTLKWEDYVSDNTVRSALERIRDRVTEMKGSVETQTASSKEGVDISQAKRVKLVVVGDGAVGKTSLLIRFATGKFPEDYLPTVFENYTAQLPLESETILLHLWDTAGQEDYDRLRPLSYPSSDVVLLCFSTISQASFEAIREKWAPEVNHYIPNIPHILVGTKIDLRESKHPDPNSGKYEPISSEQGSAMANEIGAVKYMEVSSKTGKNLQEVFIEAVRQVLKDREQHHPSASAPGGAETPNNKNKKQKKNCRLL